MGIPIMFRRAALRKTTAGFNGDIQRAALRNIFRNKIAFEIQGAAHRNH